MTSRHTEEWLQNRRFGIVIDAGSSGSRIHIYSWINREHLRETALPQDFFGVLPTIEPGVESGSPHSADWTKKTEPGIADFKDRPEDVGEHLEPLLDHALDVIPESEISRTPIYLLATAGLRLVQNEIREQILTNSCNYIKDMYNFVIDDCKDHIKNITGEEEGIYGWVAINYLMGGFDNDGVKMIEPVVPGPEQHDSEDSEAVPSVDWDRDGSNGSHRHTLGFLDMGGASTQIAFEPSLKASEEHANDLTKVTLKTLDGMTREYQVFVTTFLGYGSNQARRRYVKDYLLETNKELLETQKPGVQISIKDPCLPKQLQMSETHTTPHVPLTGSGSFTECLKRVEVLLNKDKECTDVPCLFNGVHTPPIDFNINTFIGVSEYWYSAHDILGLGGAYDYAEFERKSAEFCNADWEDIKARPEYQNQILERLEMQCFKSAWLSNVLHGGFGVPRFGEKGAVGSKEQSNEVLEKAGESIKNKNWRPPFQSINAIKDIQVTWTLGAMLLITSGSLGPFGDNSSRGHRPTQHILPPADHKAPYEDTYPERMLDNYNHVVLLVIVLFALAVIWVYRSRSSKSWPFIKRWLTPSSYGGSTGGGLPFIGRFRRTNGSSGADYSAMETGTVGGSAGSYGQPFSLKVMYLAMVHHTRSIWWSISTRVRPEHPSFTPLDGRTEETMESITITGFDGTSNTTSTMPMSSVASHHGGTPAGSFGASGLSSIPEVGAGSFEPGFHRSHSSPTSAAVAAAAAAAASSRPPKTAPRFFRINKKRFSGDSQSLLNKDGRGNKVTEEGCVVNTAILQKQTPNSVELTARSASTNLPSLWNGGNGSNGNTPTTTTNGSAPSSQTIPDHHAQSSGTPAGSSVSGWRQGWIPEEEPEDPPVPSILSSSRSHNSVNHTSGHSPLLTPMARYKQQQQDGSSSAPSSTVNLASSIRDGGTNGGSGSGFVTSADERDEWSADGGDGDDEGDGYTDQQHPSRIHNSNSSYHQFQQQAYSFRSASAAPPNRSPQQTGTLHSHPYSSHAVPTAGSSTRYKQRSAGLFSGANFETGGGAITAALESDEAAHDAGLLTGNRVLGTRSVSPMMIHQQISTSTSSLVLGRHNVSEQDQQLVSRGSSESARRSSVSVVMS